MESIKHRLADTLRNVIGSLTPIDCSNSKFESDGYLTPREFVDSGDYLILQFPNWFWRTAPKEYLVSWLPPNKQYLHIDNIPCRNRLDPSKISISKRRLDIKLDYCEEEWFIPTKNEGEPNEIELKNEIRYYDISVTYDKFFQTPRIWLFGYNKEGTPLSTEEMVEDIISDYAAKTITLDPHPFTGIPCISIHPCNHSSLLKKIAKGYPPHLSIVILLKFITTVIPSIELDNTIDIDINFYT
ncbi:APG10/Aut1p like like autophagocytosis [Cryptosporidium canis]|uniref:APG10/Aut1p like like autophagocytosis n=1 Tax=Cryptosporidium canis TaxID=195482 RepID=A0ABQ8PBE4_9CRYT|nr:APG10/Aut1p like like autophagocytosis [Cryptosporidium canis]KAJ1615124.1 APG10/Aut1p like like autophagocytosis [Cryptosporidium canis]